MKIIKEGSVVAGNYDYTIELGSEKEYDAVMKYPAPASIVKMGGDRDKWDVKLRVEGKNHNEREEEIQTFVYNAISAYIL
jgi:hypothetical protein